MILESASIDQITYSSSPRATLLANAVPAYQRFFEKELGIEGIPYMIRQRSHLRSTKASSKRRPGRLP